MSKCNNLPDVAAQGKNGVASLRMEFLKDVGLKNTPFPHTVAMFEKAICGY